jgi:hypothetical protein
MRRVGWSLGLAGLLGVGLAGCGVGGGGGDPVARSVGRQYTVAPEAEAGSEGSAASEKAQQQLQAAADRKARGRR